MDNRNSIHRYTQREALIAKASGVMLITMIHNNNHIMADIIILFHVEVNIRGTDIIARQACL